MESVSGMLRVCGLLTFVAHLRIKMSRLVVMDANSDSPFAACVSYLAHLWTDKN